MRTNEATSLSLHSAGITCDRDPTAITANRQTDCCQQSPDQLMRVVLCHVPTRLVLSTSSWERDSSTHCLALHDEWCARALLIRYCIDPFTLTQLRGLFAGDYTIRMLQDHDIISETAARISRGHWQVSTEEIGTDPQVFSAQSTPASAANTTQQSVRDPVQAAGQTIKSGHSQRSISPPVKHSPGVQKSPHPTVTIHSLGETDNEVIPALPTTLVGLQRDPRAGPNKSGTRHTSGPLTADSGGTGNYEADLELLTGGTRPWQAGDKAPPGSRVGRNGIFGRSPNSSGGKSIDIPPNGKKPHETLHY